MKRLIVWSDSDNQRLIECVQSGMTPVRAAGMFKRSITGVQFHARKLGYPIPSINERRRRMNEKIAADELNASRR